MGVPCEIILLFNVRALELSAPLIHLISLLHLMTLLSSTDVMRFFMKAVVYCAHVAFQIALYVRCAAVLTRWQRSRAMLPSLTVQLT